MKINYGGSEWSLIRLQHKMKYCTSQSQVEYVELFLSSQFYFILKQ